MPLYRDVMTLADRTSRRVSAAVGALWSAPTWRATGNALAALLVGLVGGILIGGLALIWWGAIYSLVHWPVGRGQPVGRRGCRRRRRGGRAAALGALGGSAGDAGGCRVGPGAARAGPQRGAGAAGRVAGPQPGRHRRRGRRRAPPDRAGSARRRAAAACLAGHEPRHGQGALRRCARTGTPGDRRRTRRGRAGAVGAA